MDETLENLYVNGVLKPKHQHLEVKYLTHIFHIPQGFQIKWIRFILSCVHNGQLLLKKPILITKKMIHRITSLPMLEKEKIMKTLSRVKLERKTLVRVGWKGNEDHLYYRYGIEIWDTCLRSQDLQFKKTQ